MPCYAPSARIHTRHSSKERKERKKQRGKGKTERKNLKPHTTRLAALLLPPPLLLLLLLLPPQTDPERVSLQVEHDFDGVPACCRYLKALCHA
jgi:hypothetical protein